MRNSVPSLETCLGKGPGNCPANDTGNSPRNYPEYKQSTSFAIITLFTLLANPALGQSAPTPLTNDVLDQIRAGSVAVDATADALATGLFGYTQTDAQASAKDYWCKSRGHLSIGKAQGIALAIGNTAHTDAYSSGYSNADITLSGGSHYHSVHGDISISISYHATVAISF